MDQQRIGTILEEYHTLTQNPAALAKWTEKYGHVTPEQAKMDPYLQQKLAELRSASAFTFSSYGHAENILDGAGLVAFDPAAFKEKTLNMIPTIVDGNLAPGASEGLDLTSSREHLILSPECTRKTVSKERYTLTYVYGGQTAQYGGAQPQYNKIQDPRRAGVDAREQSAGYKPLLQAMTHDQKMTSIMEHTNVDLGDRPNNLTVSVTMDKEQAMEMQQYFLQHPEMIRPFFLNGMQGLEFTHKPPPYEKTDAMPNPGIRSREFGTTVVEKDYVRRLQLRGERILQ
jgi:hypothetical protein